MTLIQCIYSSSASNPEFGTRELHDILEVSRLNNAALGVSGMLLFDEGSFFQVLEGEADTIDELFQKLHEDLRHSQINMLVSEPIEERSFSEWSMGYPEITRADIEAMPGLNDFFMNGRSYVDMENESARILLDGFRKGQ